MAPRRRRCQPRGRKALLHNATLLFVRPATPAARVNDFEPTDVTTVGKDIHTNSQLRAAQARKAVHAVCLRVSIRRGPRAERARAGERVLRRGGVDAELSVFPMPRQEVGEGLCRMAVDPGKDILRRPADRLPAQTLAVLHPLPAGRTGFLLDDCGRTSPRGFALGRRSWLFAGSERGAERSAAITTMIMTAKLNEVDPLAWLADVLARINGHPAQALADLLPWHWKDAQLGIDAAAA